MSGAAARARLSRNDGPLAAPSPSNSNVTPTTLPRLDEAHEASRAPFLAPPCLLPLGNPYAQSLASTWSRAPFLPEEAAWADRRPAATQPCLARPTGARARARLPL